MSTKHILNSVKIFLGQPESFDYPHADILNDIGSRKPWHHDYGRPNEEKVVIPKLCNNYGFKYTLEAPTSSSVRKEDDRYGFNGFNMNFM